VTREERKPFRVACSRCGDAWIAFWRPMPLADAAKILLSLRCPSCAADASLIRLEGSK